MLPTAEECNSDPIQCRFTCSVIKRPVPYQPRYMFAQTDRCCAGVDGTHCLLQILVPGLEDRAWMVPPLRSLVQVHSGKLLKSLWLL